MHGVGRGPKLSGISFYNNSSEEETKYSDSSDESGLSIFGSLIIWGHDQSPSSDELSVESNDLPYELNGSPTSFDDSLSSLPKSPYVMKRCIESIENDDLQPAGSNEQSSIKFAKTASNRSLNFLFSTSTSESPSKSLTTEPPFTSSITSTVNQQTTQSKSLPSLPIRLSFPTVSCASLPMPDSSSLPRSSSQSLPKPNSEKKAIVTTGKRVPPQTPRKPPSSLTRWIPGFVSPALAAYNKYLSIIRGLDNGRLTYQGHDYQVEAIAGAKGQYKKAFIVCPGQPELIPGRSNEEILIKAFHEECVTKDFAQIDQLTRQSIKQFRECLQHGIPVASILNIDPSTDCLIGDVFIVPNIPYAVDPQQWAIQSDGTDPLKERKPADFLEIVSVKPIFNTAIAKLVNLDAKPDNFRFYYKQTRDVVVSDFREVVEEGGESDDDDVDPLVLIETVCNLFKGVAEWANNRLEVWNFLTSDFTRLNQHKDIVFLVEQGRKEHEEVEENRSKNGSASSSSSHI
jgi:hypothetical protein